MNKAVINKSAVLSADGIYRYELVREWDSDCPTIGWIMLNPSTADASIDDPTIKKCIKFSQRWGYGRMVVGNLYAYRATDPAALRTAQVDIVGPGNDDALRRIIRASESVVCAWGTKAPHELRETHVRNLIMSWKCPMLALRITVDRHPGHPLYIRDDTQPIPYG